MVTENEVSAATTFYCDDEAEEGEVPRLEAAVAAAAASVSTVGHLTLCGITFHVTEQKEQGIAFQLWPAAQVLAEHIAQSPELVRDESVLELGSGCGVVGLMAAAQGAALVIASDTEAAIQHLQGNIDANVHAGTVPCGVISAEELDWGSKCSHNRGEFGVLLLSDCTYWQHLHEKLLGTLLHLADCTTTILLGHHWRRPEAEQPFFDTAAERFTITELGRDGDLCIMSLRLNELAPDPSSKDAANEEEDIEALLRRIALLESDLDSIQCDDEPVS